MTRPHNIFDPMGTGPHRMFEYNYEEPDSAPQTNQAYIQYQTFIGIWRTVITCSINDSIILKNMRSVQSSHPNKSVRAIDNNGNILNIL